VIEETIVCPSCGEENGMYVPKCPNCGFQFFEEKKPSPPQTANDIFDHSHQEKLGQEIQLRFNKAFDIRLDEEHHPALHGMYKARLFESDFKNSVDYRAKQLAEEIRHLEAAKNVGTKEKRAIMDPAFEELLDYFIIRYCADLNEALLPESILKYQGLPLAKIDMPQMVADYLDFENEDESVYTDFVTMPAPKLKNAAQSFLFPKKGEPIFFICNLSMLGHCKEGFSMTNTAIYWKALLEKPQRVYYGKLKEIRRQEDWITINGIFFHANKSLNLKLVRLLKKLRSLLAK